MSSTWSRAAFLVESETVVGEEISRQLGVHASDVSDRGQPVARRNPRGRKRDHTTWVLDSQLHETEELSAHLESLLAVVEPVIPAIRRLENLGCDARWSCLVVGKPTGNMVWIEPGLLSRLARVGAAFTLDVYDDEGE